MKLEWDVVRLLLMSIEKLPPNPNGDEVKAIINLDDATETYHLRLMLEAGLVARCGDGALGPIGRQSLCLTWKGHEFLALIKNLGVWHRTHLTAFLMGVDFSFEVIREIAGRVIRQMINGDWYWEDLHENQAPFEAAPANPASPVVAG